MASHALAACGGALAAGAAVAACAGGAQKRTAEDAAADDIPAASDASSAAGAGADSKRSRADKRREKNNPNEWSVGQVGYVPRMKYKALAEERKQKGEVGEEGAGKAGRAEERKIVCADALQWMDGVEELPGSVLTGMPDIQEMLELGDDGYSEWFIDCVAKTLRKLPEGQIACFHNTDTRADRDSTLSKPNLIFKGVERSGVRTTFLWHKIALAAPCGVTKMGRPGFTHMLCFVKGPPPSKRFQNFPDVVDRGPLLWSRGMGVIAIVKSIEYIRFLLGDDVVIVDPFCGHGSVPAVANSMGLRSVGVDLSPNCCRKAEQANTDALVADRAALIEGRYAAAADEEEAEERARKREDEAQKKR